MVKLAKHKWLVFLIMILVLVVFDALMYNVALDDRGIVVGIGIDIDGDDMVVSTQIMLQKIGGVSGGGSNFIVLSDKKKTVKECFDGISSKLGMPVSIAHSVVILFSKGFLEGDNHGVIKNFLVGDDVTDTISLAMTDGTPKDILSAKVPFGETASFQIGQLFKSSKLPIGIAPRSLKDYAVDFYGANTSCYLPIVHMEKTDPSSDQDKDGAKDADQLIINRTAVIAKSGYVGELDGLANEGVSLVKQTLRDGSIVITGDDNKEVSINLVESTCKDKYDIHTNTLTYEFTIQTIRNSGHKGENGNFTFLMSDIEKERFSAAIDARVQAAFKLSQEFNADFLKVYNGFYQKYGDEWVAKMGGDYLNNVTVKTKVNIKQR